MVTLSPIAMTSFNEAVPERTDVTLELWPVSIPA